MTKQSVTARSERLDEATERLTHAVEAITTGDDWQRYLAFAAQLHSYSARNVFLLLDQAEAQDGKRSDTSQGSRRGRDSGVSSARVRPR